MLRLADETRLDGAIVLVHAASELAGRKFTGVADFRTRRRFRRSAAALVGRGRATGERDRDQHEQGSHHATLSSSKELDDADCGRADEADRDATDDECTEHAKHHRDSASEEKRERRQVGDEGSMNALAQTPIGALELVDAAEE